MRQRGGEVAQCSWDGASQLVVVEIQVRQRGGEIAQCSWDGTC